MADRDEIEARSYLPADSVREPAVRRREFKVERIRRRRRGPNLGPFLIGGLSVVLVALVVVLGGRAISTIEIAPRAPRAAAPPRQQPTASPSPGPTPIPITATPENPVATGVLPDYYIIQLSATAPPQPTPLPAFVDVTPTSAFQAIPTQFSLANSLMVFVCFIEGSDDICTMNADGSNFQRIAADDNTDWYPAMALDGTQIVYSSQRGGDFDIWIMDPDGGNQRQVTDNLGMNFAPDLSPDGTRVVFASTAGGDGKVQNIWAINVDGTNPVQLTDNPFDDIDPTWSPDGRQIVFSSNRSGTTELHVMNADGSNIRQLTEGINVGGRNDWSPDGAWLTFYAGPPGNKNVYLLDASCAWSQVGCITEPVLLVAEGNSKGPSFSPDSRWVVFAGSLFQGDPDNEIYVVSLDGQTLYKLTNNSYADWQPRWAP